MKNIKSISSLIIVIGISFLLQACERYLEAKPDKQLVLPSTIKDLQALLDNAAVMNRNIIEIGELSADDYYLSDADYNASSDASKNIYTWGEEVIYDTWPNGWSENYNIVYNSNVVLDNIDKIARTEQNSVDWDNAMGSALFFRARALSQVMFTWTNSYSKATSNSDMGIPLRTSSDFNMVSTRGNVEDNYQQIIADLKSAASLLPLRPLHVLRPSKLAAYGLLSRIYLSMGEYSLSLQCADSVMKVDSSLIDFNNLNASLNYPISAYNKEVLFHTELAAPTRLASTRAKIDTVLYKSYDSLDLRKSIYFKVNTDGSYQFRGSYVGSTPMFGGIAIDEILLTKAECLCRLGNIEQAKDELNYLLSKRWKSGSFEPIKETDESVLLKIILTERRKELLFRCVRWMDLKRFNRDGADIQPERIIAGQHYILEPKSNRWTLPIPATIISMTGMQQNPR